MRRAKGVASRSWTSALRRRSSTCIYRALLTPEHFEEISAGFGGIEVHRLADGKLDQHELAHAIATKVLRTGWYYEVLQMPDGGVRVVVNGRS